MSSQKLFLIGFLLLILSACSILNPYIDRKRNPGVSDISQLYSGSSTPQNPVICYNMLLTSDADLQQMANDECATQKTGDYAELTEKQHFECKLLLPSRAHFKCVKNGMENNKEK